MRHILNVKENKFLEVEETAEEIAQRETDIANAEADLETKATAKTKADADAKSGNDKLLALGLSQAEVTAMTGYIVPKDIEEDVEE